MLSQDLLTHKHACHELVGIIRHYLRPKSKGGVRDLHQKLSEFYSTHGLGLLESFSRVRDVKFIFPASALEQMKPHLVGRKSALYAGCTLCVLPSLFHYGRSRVDSADYFCDFIQTNASLISSGRVIPFPSIDMTPSYQQHFYRRQRAEELYAIQRKIDESRVATWVEKSDAVPVFGRHQALLAQMNEDMGETRYQPVGSQTILLPTLEGVDTETLLCIMEDHGDPTQRFREVLHGVLKTAATLDSDRKLLEVFQRVDYEVRSLEQKMEGIRAERNRAGAEAILGMVSTSLSLLAPDYMLKSVGAAFGSVTALDGFRALNKVATERQKLTQSDFFVPWLVHRAAEK